MPENVVDFETFDNYDNVYSTCMHKLCGQISLPIELVWMMLLVTFHFGVGSYIYGSSLLFSRNIGYDLYRGTMDTLLLLLLFFIVWKQ